MNIAVTVRVDFVTWFVLFAVSDSVEPVISPFVSSYFFCLDKAPLR